MSDRSCVYCDDRGDCTRCSWFWEPDKVHAVCGRKWKHHRVESQESYPPFTVCPIVPVTS